MNVPESEKGGEDGQDEDVPEPVLLIRLDEADALVHLKSMVSSHLSPHFASRSSSSSFHFYGKRNFAPPALSSSS